MVRTFLIAMVVGIGTGLIALNAFAAPQFKPGLWEQRVSMTMSGAGIPAGAGGGRDATVQICMQPTKDSWQSMLRRMQEDSKGDCSMKDIKEAGGSFSFTMACKSGLTGQVKGTFTPTSIQQTGVMSMGGQGGAMQMNYTSAARWKADSCPEGAPGAVRR